MSSSINIENLIDLIDENSTFAILHTGKKTPYTSNKTIILTGLKKLHRFNKFSDFQQFAATSDALNLVGYFSYDLKNELETLPFESNQHLSIPKICFAEFTEKQVFENIKFPEYFCPPPKIKSLKSNYTKAQYLEKVSTIIDKIKSGDIYQANLTKKFFGEFSETPSALKLFLSLCSSSPAPYSAFLNFHDVDSAQNLKIISSSPELFLRLEGDKVVTCPIKGSAFASNENQSRENLKQSTKNISENLMITDLMRNDFSRSCLAGSVKVTDLFETAEFKTITHMYSTIEGQLKSKSEFFDLFKNSFPPGSMTGAPKIEAMKTCTQLEDWGRGIYSGALGYFNADLSVAEFSVVIRTLIIQDNKFEFQAGGGIVYDSLPEKEFSEMLAKLSPIAKLLGVFDQCSEL